MGKGDKKSRKGKITIGSYGVSRPRKKTKTIAATTPKAPKVVKEKKEAAPKKAAKKAAKKAE